MKLIALFLIILLLTGCAAPAQPEASLPAAVPEATEITSPTPIPALPREPETIDTVPVYYQTDYPFIRCGNGTIASSGCSMTCLAMAASYVTDRVYTPDMLVWEFGSYGETNIQRLNHAIEQMQLPCEKNTDWRITKQALREGKIAIVLMDERSDFTNSAHFVLISGINDQGRYMVLDPFRPNYEEDYLAAGFERGFTEGQILAGLEGSWVFDKSKMGTFRYDIQMPDFPKTRYGDYRPADPDVELLARFLWVAAREESFETQQALAEVVLNRMADSRFPYLPEQVLQQEDLITWYRQTPNAQPDVRHYSAVTNAIYGPHVLPDNVFYAAPWLSGSKNKTWGQLGSFTFLYER